MLRTVFVTMHCTAGERDRGIDHYDKFKTQEEAIKKADELSANEFISVEKWIQKYTPAPVGRRYKNDELGWETIESETL